MFHTGPTGNRSSQAAHDWYINDLYSMYNFKILLLSAAIMTVEWGALGFPLTLKPFSGGKCSGPWAVGQHVMHVFSPSWRWAKVFFFLLFPFSILTLAPTLPLSIVGNIENVIVDVYGSYTYCYWTHRLPTTHYQWCATHGQHVVERWRQEAGVILEIQRLST